MRIATALFIVCLSITTNSRYSHAQDSMAPQTWYQGYFYGIDQNFINSFTGYNAINHLTAIGSTYVLVENDIDQHYSEYFKARKNLQYLTFPAVVLGGLGAIAIPASLHSAGIKQNDLKQQYAAYAVGQSVILSVGITSIYKSFTGREEPNVLAHDGGTNNSRDFKFGFMRNGIFNGWPSGHAATATAIATSLMQLYPEKKAQHALWGLSALYVSLGVASNIHWLSDATAGILIGCSIGKTVGENYAARLSDKQRVSDSATILPFAAGDAVGVSYRRYLW